jgi:hypothetical protein
MEQIIARLTTMAAEVRQMQVDLNIEANARRQRQRGNYGRLESEVRRLFGTAATLDGHAQRLKGI